MTKTLAPLAALLALSLLPLLATAEETVVDGTVSGYVATVTKTPPALDKDDPAIEAERLFVVTTDDGYYFLPNISRRTLRRYATGRVRVAGDLDKSRHSIRASTIEARNGEQWTQVWSQKQEERKQWNREQRYLRD